MGMYVDGFLLPVPTKNLLAYKKMAKLACKVWIEHGALSYVEATGDDLKVDFGLPFGKLMKNKPSETVVMAFITYKSKADRNRVTKLVMSDPRLTAMMGKDMPFDMTKMSFGGFKALVEG
ncbi:MAG: DUF1428 domain-containing protein [Proteobacteria bacterium]|nr:MAG: DUF1428 domain-containing protein [Pseudomonadota bacterium]